MKLELRLEDGTTKIVEGVVSFKEIKAQVLGYDIALTPTEEMLFEVKPLAIDRRLFEWPMRNCEQESTRELINEAFTEVDKHPEKYASPFYTLIPKMTWGDCKTVAELKMYASDLGGEMADWVEQALEWAQRISNGESWKSICNDEDTANWCRMIIWKNHSAKLVGGSIIDCCAAASDISFFDILFDFANEGVVPLVVIRK